MTRKAIISREGSLTNVNPMSENERLREALEALVYALDFEDLSDSVDLNGAKSALAAKPDVCVWDNIDRLVPLRSCRAHTRVIFSETLLFAVLDEAKRTDGILCPGCGRKIEVRE